MAKSKAFAGIKRDVLLITSALPPGRVTTNKSIGTFMNIVPRHVAYILATLTPEEQLTTPWYRVVGDDGKLGKRKVDAAGQTQAELLIAEGIQVVAGAVVAFDELLVEASTLNSSVIPHRLYKDE
jgi:methylated-DNA-protein-cysteine methyltransferase related protein